MSETGENGQHPQFERRSLQLAEVFSISAATFGELPEQFQSFCVYIGYVRVTSLLVISDLQKGRTRRKGYSENELATRYGLTRDQIRYIKENSRLCGRQSQDI
jgi:hypothetical protein